MVNAIIVVDCAILSAETQCALADVVVTTVCACGAVFTRVKFFGAELNFLLAKVAYFLVIEAFKTVSRARIFENRILKEMELIQGF